MIKIKISRKSGYAALIILMFTIISAILAQKVYVNAETFVKSEKETLLKQQLLEYNMAIIRFGAENKRCPETIDELLKFPGGLRQIYKDPMTLEKTFRLIKNKSGCYAASNSKSESFLKIPYDKLTVDITGNFIANFDK